MPQHLVQRRTARAAVLATLLGGALLGCATDGRFPAQFDTVTFSETLGAINGTPLGEPAALALADLRVVRLDQSYAFDVAFDIDAQGRAVVFPPDLVGLSGGGGRPTRLQRLGASFEQATIAPRATSAAWVADSVFAVLPGEVIGVLMRPSECIFDFDQYMYARVRVDSVTVATRRVHITATLNPNCGYRSFLPGRPTN
jgi:hypothetical protein